MKTYWNIFLSLLVILFFLSSCLDGNLEELDTYTGCEITSIQGVYYRYYSTETIPASGEQAVQQISLTVSNTESESELGTLNFTVSIPSNFPESERGNVSSSGLVVVVNLSAAALIKPVGDAPTLGVPGDWSKPNQYKVTAANGDEKVWALSMTFE